MSAIWDTILIVIALFLPPLSAFFKRGLHHEFWISILLTIIGWLPGVIYTWWVILTRHHRTHYHYIPQTYAVNRLPVVNPHPHLHHHRPHPGF